MNIGQFSKRSSNNAFSLIEIVLAVGIISFALVGILGLFPVALDAAADSREETQSAFIAQQIYAGLFTPTPFLPGKSGTEFESAVGKAVDLRGTGSETLYAQHSGEISAVRTQASIYEATVNWTADAPVNGLTRIDLVVTTPPDSKTSSYPFVSFVRQLAIPASTPLP